MPARFNFGQEFQNLLVRLAPKIFFRAKLLVPQSTDSKLTPGRKMIAVGGLGGIASPPFVQFVETSLGIRWQGPTRLAESLEARVDFLLDNIVEHRLINIVREQLTRGTCEQLAD